MAEKCCDIASYWQNMLLADESAMGYSTEGIKSPGEEMKSRIKLCLLQKYRNMIYRNLPHLDLAPGLATPDLDGIPGQELFSLH